MSDRLVADSATEPGRGRGISMMLSGVPVTGAVIPRLLAAACEYAAPSPRSFCTRWCGSYVQRAHGWAVTELFVDPKDQHWERANHQQYAAERDEQRSHPYRTVFRRLR